MATAQAKKILFLGDSYTVGTGLGEGHEREAFPYQLKVLLEQQGATVAEPKLYAVGGDTSKHLLGALNAMEPLSNPGHAQHNAYKGGYDLVILSIGINDIYRGHTCADYAHHFTELLQRAVRFAGGETAKVLVISIPAWDATPAAVSGEGFVHRADKYAQVRQVMRERPDYNTIAGIAMEIDAFNHAAREVAEALNQQQGGRGAIRFIDITDITRVQATLPDGQPDGALFTQDGTHYSGKMYGRWVARILPTVQEMLRKL